LKTDFVFSSIRGEWTQGDRGPTDRLVERVLRGLRGLSCDRPGVAAAGRRAWLPSEEVDCRFSGRTARFTLATVGE
jgi:hypothetical protein